MTRKQADAFGGGLFLIALGAIFLIKELAFWPWILVALAAVQLPSLFNRPGRWLAWQSIIWLVGIAVLVYLGIIWPGILFVIGASVIAWSLRGERQGHKQED